MDLPFTKMHGLGNDFVVLNCMQKSFELDGDQIRSLGDRHFGIGFDQMLVIGPPENPDADISYRIFNNDGNEVAQCGNGARCIAAYLVEKGIIRKQEVIADTHAGRLVLQRQPDGQVTVNMGIPRFEPDEIPMHAGHREPEYRLQVNDKEYLCHALSMGNPHVVLPCNDIDTVAVNILGPRIQQLEVFPEGVNVGFMQVQEPNRIRLRVYERGAGETLACGSGACAAVVAGILYHQMEKEVIVVLQGGDLLVSWTGEGDPVMMTGPATFVYEGRILL